MKKEKEIPLMLMNLSRFISENNIAPENVEALLKYLTTNDLKPTWENLTAAHKTLSDRYWSEHPDEAPSVSADSIEKMSADAFKKKLQTDPIFAKAVEKALTEEKR
jgi:hypothetical protein